MQVTGSHLRENQEEHPILSETEGEFGNSLFDSLSDFDYSNESNEERSFFQNSANLSDELSNHNLTTEEIVEALMEFDETLDSGKNLVDYVNGSDELPKQSKQTDKQPIPQTGHTLSILPQNVTKNDYLKYIQLYQSINQLSQERHFVTY
ncbi:hypothetical protein EWY09_RS09595 [Enterococcus hirae]